MTRQDFIENVNEWYELLEFCRHEDCDVCEDVYSDDDKDDYINENFRYLVEEHNWWTLRDILNDIPTGDGYYLYENINDWRELDDEDFEEFKGSVLQWMDNGGYWEEEEEYEEYEEEPFVENVNPIDPYDAVPIEDEDISLPELLSACDKELRSIKKATDEDNEADNEVFFDFVASITVKKAR